MYFHAPESAADFQFAVTVAFIVCKKGESIYFFSFIFHSNIYNMYTGKLQSSLLSNRKETTPRKGKVRNTSAEKAMELHAHNGDLQK